MARRCRIIALLDPESAFEHIVEIVATDFGTLEIIGKRLALTFDTEDDEVLKVAEKMKTAFVFLKVFASTLAWVTGLGVTYEVLDFLQLFGDGTLQTTSSVLSDKQPSPKIAVTSHRQRGYCRSLCRMHM